jgi:hypothetical protein
MTTRLLQALCAALNAAFNGLILAYVGVRGYPLMIIMAMSFVVPLLLLNVFGMASADEE